MLKSRRAFLDRGLYTPLSEAINQQVYDHLVTTGDLSAPSCIGDVGCGEGYYIGNLKAYLDSQSEPVKPCYFGFDISKEATKLAARKYKGIHFVVADINRKLLLAGHKAQVLLNIFAPRNPLEFQRVLAPGGLLIVVIPEANHLIDLQLGLELLEIQKNKKQHVIEQFISMFKLKEDHALDYKLDLNGEDLVDLLKMTPNYWHIPEETWTDLKAVDRVQATASFIILKFCSIR